MLFKRSFYGQLKYINKFKSCTKTKTIYIYIEDVYNENDYLI